MASPITLLKSFTDGQGAGAQTYVTYDGDLDSNFSILESQFNTLAAEVKASGATNAGLAFDLVQSSLPAILEGIVGFDSFHDITFPTTTTITIPAGVAVAAGSRISTAETILSVGTADSWWIAVNLNGTVSLETAADQGALDIYTIDTTGLGVFTTASLTFIAEVMPAGTDFQNQRIVVDDLHGGFVGVPDYTYSVIADRLTDMHRVMIGLTGSADADQAVLGGMAFNGTEALPGLSLANGTSWETTTGLYRSATNVLGLSVLATNLLLCGESVANEPQLRMRGGTDLTAPPIAWGADLDTGFGYVSANVHRAVAGGVEAFRFAVDGANGVRAAFVGDPDTGSNPGLAVIGDLNTGLFADTADQLEIMTGGVSAQQWNSVQQRTSVTQGRVSVDDASAQTLTTATPAAVLFDQENFDVGGFHDNVTNNDRITVPTGFDGTYLIIGSAEFDANVTGARELNLTLGSTVIASQRVLAAPTGTTDLTVCWMGQLVATDIIRLNAEQVSGGNLDINVHHLEVKLLD